MPNKHKFRLMRPHSELVNQLAGEYPLSVNTALSRYLHLVAIAPDFSESEWNLLYDACNGWATQMEPPDVLAQGLVLQVQDAIGFECLGEKWGVDTDRLIARLNTLSPVEAIAVIHKIERWWSKAEGGS